MQIFKSHVNSWLILYRPAKVALKLVQKLGRDKQSKMYLKFEVFLPLLPSIYFCRALFLRNVDYTLSGIGCRLNFENRPVRSRDIKGVVNSPLATITGVARSLSMIGCPIPRGLFIRSSLLPSIGLFRYIWVTPNARATCKHEGVLDC